MSEIIEKVKKILTKPKEFFESVAEEQVDLKGLITGYVIYLAAIPAVANFIGYTMIGVSFGPWGRLKYPLKYSLPHAIIWYIVSIAAVIGISILAAKIAPKFGGKDDVNSAAKSIVYSYTAAWVGGIFYIIPGLSALAFIAGLYSFYLLYISLGKLLDVPQEKNMGFLVTVIIAMIVATFLVGVFANLAIPNVPGL